MEWYYANESDQQIPFSEEDFKGLVEVGSIKPDTLVWNATMPDWKQASIVQPALFGSAAITPAPAQPGQPAVPPTYRPAGTMDGLALASMICGIFAILLSCGYGIGILPGIAAIICGHMSRKKMAEGGPTDSAGMTTAGLIMGYIGSAISVILIIIFIVFIGFAIVSAETMESA